MAIGVLGAVLLALMAERISGLFDGIGQDVVNIVVLSLALVFLLWHCIWVASHAKEMSAHARRLGASVQDGRKPPWALLFAVVLAVLREGAETVLFVAGAVSGTNASTQSIVLATLVGVAAGAAVGALMYAGLTRIPVRHLFTATNLLIALLAGSIASQLARSLTQAGLVDFWSLPLWDSSHWLAPDSALGTLLHALVGYDAQPSGLQLVAYAGALALIYVGTQVLKPRPAGAVPA